MRSLLRAAPWKGCSLKEATLEEASFLTMLPPTGLLTEEASFQMKPLPGMGQLQ